MWGPEEKSFSTSNSCYNVIVPQVAIGPGGNASVPHEYGNVYSALWEDLGIFGGRGIKGKGKRRKLWSVHALWIAFKIYTIRRKKQRKTSWRTENTLPPFYL